MFTQKKFLFSALEVGLKYETLVLNTYRGLNPLIPSPRGKIRRTGTLVLAWRKIWTEEKSHLGSLKDNIM